MKNKWKEFFKKENAVVVFITTIVVLLVCLFSLSRFIVFVEGRAGVILDDPLFHFFKAVDLNIPIFVFIYVSIIWCMLYLAIEEPLGLVIALQTYSLLVLVRMAMMYTVPLDPPIGTIDLQDPLVFIVGTGQKITKDLFFSGHTSILFMMILVTRKKWLKYIFMMNTFIVGSFVIIQKVHYTIDVLVAPFIAFTCYKIIIYLNEKYLTKSKY